MAGALRDQRRGQPEVFTALAEKAMAYIHEMDKAERTANEKPSTNG
jgi:hypothetical protein